MQDISLKYGSTQIKKVVCSFGLLPKAQNHFLLFILGWWCNSNVWGTNSMTQLLNPKSPSPQS